ncbi:hypothetical protein IMZ11_25795 [Microtetraspora sp. AC03309]|uniref:hypothetical protein n=1 Tax=Microtetraspora sp. AC03309 TaxID=2779376 RepID=UPI001E447DE7|nr:hypothetical protein [Microtetraspora sp. AC03309]MCC5579043.1 hypothetical protein [Microtetraspora sp. AC03309]
MPAGTAALVGLVLRPDGSRFSGPTLRLIPHAPLRCASSRHYAAGSSTTRNPPTGPYASNPVPLSENRDLAFVYHWMTIHHTADPLGYDAQSVRDTQAKQINEKKSDIAYHFLGGPDPGGRRRPAGGAGEPVHYDDVRGDFLSVAAAKSIEASWDHTPDRGGRYALIHLPAVLV